jgi:hypothetical protein
LKITLGPETEAQRKMFEEKKTKVKISCDYLFKMTELKGHSHQILGYILASGKLN